jgi:uncharacterized Zn finger protein (UPF0148 family)
MCGTRLWTKEGGEMECKACGVRFNVIEDEDGEETWTLQWSYGG